MAQNLKEKLNIAALKQIEKVLLKCDASLHTQKFVLECSKDLETLELKARVAHIAKHLHMIFPSDFARTAKILEKLPQKWEKNADNASWFDFAAWPLIDYVSEYGLNEPDVSLNVLKKITHLFSAEFAIRAFIANHFDVCMDHFQIWIDDNDEHVRRLVSEGLRLRLPWAKKIDLLFKKIDVTLPLVLKLVDDESLYVRKSVANHLNDISKYDPNLVIKTCEQILKNPTKNRQWIVKRAQRTLRKNGII